MRSLRAVLLGLLGTAVLFGISLGTTRWQDKVSSAVLRWIESGSNDERVVLVEIEGESGTQPAPDSYAAASHLAWLSMQQEAAARVETCAALERTCSLLRAGGVAWELGLPYLHELRCLIVRGSRDGIRQIAQLESVAAVLDGAAAVPVPTPPAAPGPGDTRPAEPSALFSLATVSGDDLAGWIAGFGWRFLAAEHVVVSDDPEQPLGLAAVPGMDVASSYELAGYAVSDLDRRAVESAGGGLAAAVSSAVWAQSLDFAPTVAELAGWLEAMRQADADAIVIAPIVLSSRTCFLYVLLRAGSGASGSSFTSPGAGPMAARGDLPRAEAPGSIDATKGSHADRVSLEWNPVAGSGLYEVLRADAPSGAVEPIGVTQTTAYDDRDVTECVQHWYRVRTLGDGGVGVESASSIGYVGLVPPAVQQIWTTPGNGAEIRIDWTRAEGASEYKLTRREMYTDRPTIPARLYWIYRGSDLFFVDRDVVVGQEYLYAVYAHNGCGDADQSRAVKGMALFDFPSDPTKIGPPVWVEATRGSPGDRIVVAWRAVAGVEAYRVLRATAYEGPYDEVAVTSACAWEDVSVAFCKDYWYRVQSLAGREESLPSSSAHGICGHQPAIPSGLRASVGSSRDSIEIAWEPVPDAAGYSIRRAPAPDGPYAWIVTTQTATQTRYEDVGLVPGQEFWYKMQAWNACGWGGFSVVVRGATSPE